MVPDPDIDWLAVLVALAVEDSLADWDCDAEPEPDADPLPDCVNDTVIVCERVVLWLAL